MNVDDFAYDLPEELIAAHPAPRRDASRLMVLPRDPAQPFGHLSFAGIGALLRPGDLLVLNDTRVIPARLFANRRTGGRVEILLLEETEAGPPAKWTALVRPARKIRIGEPLEIAPGFRAAVVAEHPGGERTVRLDCGGRPLMECLAAHGRLPVPPYILKRRAAESPGADAEELHAEADRDRYQTVFAAEHGRSVAAPTAGLHFTPELLLALESAGVRRTHVTLHVGAGTFQTMEPGGRVADHRMHFEEYEVSPAAAEAVASARRKGRRIVAVGTTSVRTLESAWADGALRPGRGRTNLMIAPGHRFRAVDALVTNFHLPRSTLLLLVSAMAGRERLLAAYAEAIAMRYRFFSYGDAMFVERVGIDG